MEIIDIKHLSLKDKAYEVIKAKILASEIMPGQRIREDLLAEEISMSRTPVREAINQLVAEGLIKNIPRKGIYCIELTEEKIKDILDVREVLEILAIDKCIDKINSVQLCNLESIVYHIEKAISEKRYTDCSLLDGQFHQEIALITGNEKLIGFLSEIRDYIQILRVILEKQSLSGERSKTAFKEHNLILNAIKTGDKVSAKGIMKTHIESMKLYLGI